MPILNFYYLYIDSENNIIRIPLDEAPADLQDSFFASGTNIDDIKRQIDVEEAQNHYGEYYVNKHMGIYFFNNEFKESFNQYLDTRLHRCLRDNIEPNKCPPERRRQITENTNCPTRLEIINEIVNASRSVHNKKIVEQDKLITHNQDIIERNSQNPKSQEPRAIEANRKKMEFLRKVKTDLAAIHPPTKPVYIQGGIIRDLLKNNLTINIDNDCDINFITPYSDVKSFFDIYNCNILQGYHDQSGYIRLGDNNDTKSHIEGSVIVPSTHNSAFFEARCNNLSIHIHRDDCNIMYLVDPFNTDGLNDIIGQQHIIYHAPIYDIENNNEWSLWKTNDKSGRLFYRMLKFAKRGFKIDFRTAFEIINEFYLEKMHNPDDIDKIFEHLDSQQTNDYFNRNNGIFKTIINELKTSENENLLVNRRHLLNNTADYLDKMFNDIITQLTLLDYIYEESGVFHCNYCKTISVVNKFINDTCARTYTQFNIDSIFLISNFIELKRNIESYIATNINDIVEDVAFPRSIKQKMIDPNFLEIFKKNIIYNTCKKITDRMNALAAKFQNDYNDLKKKYLNNLIILLNEYDAQQPESRIVLYRIIIMILYFQYTYLLYLTQIVIFNKSLEYIQAEKRLIASVPQTAEYAQAYEYLKEIYLQLLLIPDINNKGIFFRFLSKLITKDMENDKKFNNINLEFNFDKDRLTEIIHNLDTNDTDDILNFINVKSDTMKIYGLLMDLITRMSASPIENEHNQNLYVKELFDLIKHIPLQNLFGGKLSKNNKKGRKVSRINKKGNKVSRNNNKKRISRNKNTYNKINHKKSRARSQK